MINAEMSSDLLNWTLQVNAGHYLAEKSGSKVRHRDPV